MSPKTELLSPAGNFEALKAAVESGADAVYMGMTHFNARLKSDNFDQDDFERAVDYAHSKDVFVYLTLNTLVRDDELDLALETARKAANIGVDAYIVQDLGFAKLIHDNFPQIPIHTSTQMSITDSAGVEFAKGIGAKRVVLARELSLKEIQEIAKSTDLEIEVFVHGALCISVSGQCLMSSMMGGRSGNRGVCAQPCRLSYKHFPVEKHTANDYLLSPKDLCGLTEIPQLVSAGVKSLKIEGRLKSPEYIAATTSIYRRYLDFALENSESFNVEQSDLDTLMQVFNRGGKNSGWLNPDARGSLMCTEKPKNWGVPIGVTTKGSLESQLAEVRLEKSVSIGDGIEIWNGQEPSPGCVVSIMKKGNVHIKETSPGDVVSLGVVKGKFSAGDKVHKTSSKSLRENLLKTVNEELRKVSISGEISIKSGYPVVLRVEDKKGNQINVKSELNVEISQKVVITRDRIKQQLEKTGETPFAFEMIDIELDEGVYFPLSEISALRRLALEKLNEIRIKKYKRDLPSVTTSEPLPTFVANKKISVFFYDKANKEILKHKDIDRVYIPVNAFQEVKNCNAEIFAWLPSGTMEADRKFIDQSVKHAVESGAIGFLLGGLGDLKYIAQYPEMKFGLNYGFNIYNSESMNLFDNYTKTVSPELDVTQISLLAGQHLEAIVFGRVKVMTSRQIFKGDIQDSRGRHFPVLKSHNESGSTILGAEQINLLGGVSRMRNVEYYRIEIFDEEELEWQTQLKCLLKSIRMG